MLINELQRLGAKNLFTAVADALAWANYCHGVKYLLQYLDNFLFIGATESDDAA